MALLAFSILVTYLIDGSRDVFTVDKREEGVSPVTEQEKKNSFYGKLQWARVIG